MQTLRHSTVMQCADKEKAGGTCSQEEGMGRLREEEPEKLTVLEGEKVRGQILGVMAKASSALPNTKK